MTDVNLRIITSLVGDASRLLGRDAQRIESLDRKQTHARSREAQKRVAIAEGESSVITGTAVAGQKFQTSALRTESTKRHGVAARFRRRFLSDERGFLSRLHRMQKGAMLLGRGGLAAGGRMAGRFGRDARSLLGLRSVLAGGIMGVGVGAAMKGTIGAADRVQQSALLTHMQLGGDDEALAQVQRSIQALSVDLGTSGATRAMQTALRITNNDVGQASSAARLSAALAALDPSQGVEGALSTIEDLQFGRTRRLRRNFGLDVDPNDAMARLESRGITGDAAQKQIGTELLVMVNEKLDELYGDGKGGSGVSGLLNAADQTVGGQLDLIKNEMGNIAIAIGQPILGTVVERLKSLRSQFDTFKKTPQFASMIKGASKIIGSAAGALLGILEKIPTQLGRLFDRLNNPSTRDAFSKLAESAQRFWNLIKKAGTFALDHLPQAFQIAGTAIEGAKPTLKLIGHAMDKLSAVADNPKVTKLLGLAGGAYLFDRATGGALRETGGAVGKGVLRGVARYAAGKFGGVGGAAMKGLAGSIGATPVYVTNWEGNKGGGVGVVENVAKSKLVKSVAKWAGRALFGAEATAEGAAVGTAAAEGAAAGTLAGASAGTLATLAGVPLAFAGSILGGLYALGRAGDPTEKDMARMKKRGADILGTGGVSSMSDKQIKKRVKFLRRTGQDDEAEKLLAKRDAARKVEKTVQAPVTITPTIHIAGTPSPAQIEELDQYFQGPFRQIFTRTMQDVIRDEANRNGV